MSNCLVERQLKHSPKFFYTLNQSGDNIQDDAGGNDNIVGGDNIGRCEKKVHRITEAFTEVFLHFKPEWGQYTG